MPFTPYWVLLTVSGVLMLAIAGTGYGQKSSGQRALSALFGLGFAAYGLYLGLIFNGGTYYVFFYAFVLPIALVVNAVRNANARKANQAATNRAATNQVVMNEPATVQPVAAQPAAAQPAADPVAPPSA